MDLKSLLESNDLKSMEKRIEIVHALQLGLLQIHEIVEVSSKVNDKKLATILEAMEEITRSKPEKSTLEWLLFAEKYIDAPSNTLKREASRIVGNIAEFFENNLETSIQKLLQNTKNEGTVVRWGSAYAFAKIIVLPYFANNELFDILSEICENETESGVKNQYLKALKKATMLRKRA